jgi:hypothetical protein
VQRAGFGLHSGADSAPSATHEKNASSTQLVNITKEYTNTGNAFDLAISTSRKGLDGKVAINVPLDDFYFALIPALFFSSLAR